jgi:hypothetical protein
MILKLIKQLIRKIRGQKEESHKPTDIESYCLPEKKTYPIPKSRNFKSRPAYEKRLWKSTKKMPKKFKDENED